MNKMAIQVTVSILSFAFCIAFVNSQTYCSLKFSAQDTSVCDATGSLEENINANVYQTKGNIDVMQDYQQETFAIFDQQITDIVEGEQTTKADVTGLAEEVTALKRIMVDMSNGLMTTTSGPPVRSRRAASSGTNSAQLALNSANLVFKQNVSDVLVQLQNISKILENEATRSAGEHAAMLQEVSSNRQDLSVVDRQIQTLDAGIRQLAASKTSGPTGVNLTSVTQEVTQLVIDATVSEQIVQRQLDNDAQLVKQMEADEQKADTDIQSINATLNQADKDLNNETSQISTLQGAEKFNENLVETFINKSNDQIGNLTTEVNAADASLSKVGNDVLTSTVNQNTLTRDLKAYRQQVDGIQSVVSFTKKTQQQQLGELLKIKLEFIDDLNVLKYAFGIITQVP